MLWPDWPLILELGKRCILMNGFFNSQFNYCPVIWMCHSRALNNKINRLHEQCLRIICNDKTPTFNPSFPGLFWSCVARGEGGGTLCPLFLKSGRVELWTWNLAQWYPVTLQIKWHKKKFSMVTSVVMASLIIRTLAQNYAKKCKNGTISKIEIVRVRKKIFHFSFQFLKAKRS